MHADEVLEGEGAPGCIALQPLLPGVCVAWRGVAWRGVACGSVDQGLEGAGAQPGADWVIVEEALAQHPPRAAQRIGVGAAPR